MPRLRVSPEGGASSFFTLPLSPITIGRSQSCDLVLDDKCCSSRHATVFPTPDGYAIQDLSSKNGTSVNDESIRQKTVLSFGDEIRIGSTVLRFERESAEEEPEESGTHTDRSGTVINVPELLNRSPLPAGPGRPDGTPRRPLSPRDQEDAAIIDEANKDFLYSDAQLDKYLDRIMSVITEHIPMDRGILMLKDEASGELAAQVTKYLRHPRKAAGLPMSQSIIRKALDENSSVLIPDTQSQPLLRNADSIIRAHIHSAMCVPLYNNKEIMGVVYADRISVRDPFDPTDLRRLTLLANQAAVRIKEDRQRRALDEIARIKKELDQARQYLQYLFPKGDPDFEPFDISGRSQTSPTVGADYFDYVRLEPSRLGVVIADVVGTGIGASLLMSHLSGALLSEVRSANDLGELSARLNDSIYSKTEPSSFISFFIGVVDRGAEEITYVNAGHNYPLLMDPQGHVQPLTSTGMCLGMFAGMCYETKTVPIRPGDLLCLYTDGIVEHRNEGREEFGEDRLIETLKTWIHLPARQVLDKVYEAVWEFSPGTVPDDDMTMVVLKRKA